MLLHCSQIVIVLYLVNLLSAIPNLEWNGSAGTAGPILASLNSTDPIELVEETGVLADEMEPRIVNGRNMDISQVPYQVQILHYSTLHCGGSIVTKYHVVSAAHCFDRQGIANPRTAYTIVAGTSHAYRGTSYEVDMVVIHPSYNGAIFDYDAAVLRVSSPFNENQNMKPIPLSSVSVQQMHGREGLITGWGHTEYLGSSPSYLQHIYLPVWTRQNCVSAVQPNIMTDRMFCAGFVDYSSCHGDSGGPFVLNGELFGIVSWGIECSKWGKPSVYTHVPSVKTWLQNVIRNSSK